MPPGYVVPLALGIVVYLFAESMIHVRRFGPVTDGARSEDTGGLAFRVLGLLLVGVGVVKFVQTSVLP